LPVSFPVQITYRIVSYRLSHSVAVLHMRWCMICTGKLAAKLPV